jgi:hypothetical protein
MNLVQHGIEIIGCRFNRRQWPQSAMESGY